MGYRYRLHVAKMPGKPDLVFSKLKCVIEVRGCFWHQHRGCSRSDIPKTRPEFWGPKLSRNQRRDEENMRKIRHLGWRLCVVWECETKDTGKLFKRLGSLPGRAESAHGLWHQQYTLIFNRYFIIWGQGKLLKYLRK